MIIDCTRAKNRQGAEGFALVWLGLCVLCMWADAASATAGSSTGGSSSTGSTGIAGGVSANATAYLWAPLIGSVFGIWWSIRRRATRWANQLSGFRKGLGVIAFAWFALQVADYHGALLWVGVSLTFLLGERDLPTGHPIRDEDMQLSAAWVRVGLPELCLATTWLLYDAGLRVVALLLAPLWLICVTRSYQRVERNLPLLAASAAVFLLGIREALDPMLARFMALASAWVLSGTGAILHVEGVSILGLGAPVHVSAACAGVVVTLTPFVIGAVVSALWQTPTPLQWKAALGLFGAAALLNWIRIVAVGFSGLWWSAAEMQRFHDVVGWPLAALLYGGFAFWCRRRSQVTASR